jgi:two-component system, chemotaxis family, chemotaxis protein CheY
MAQLDLAAARILVVGAKGPAGSMLRAVLTAAGITHVTLADEPRRGLDMLCAEPFDAVFVEGSTQLDDTSFALAARRNTMLLNPMIPIFAVFGGPRRRDVEMARDQGITDVICRPMSPKTVTDKLRAALRAPRPFIAAPEFFGPDRRAKERSWRGEDRRVRTPKKTKVNFDLD